MVFLMVFLSTLILLSSNEAKDKIRKLFRKRMKALDTNDMMKLFNQSQKIAVKTKEDFDAQKSKIEVQEAVKAPSSPESQNEIIPAENESVEVAEEVPHDEIVKEEIPSQNEIEDLSNEIVNEMRKEPMVLQPQAGFGTAQEEVDRIYDYMQPMITCNDNHYVGTKGNSGAYQDGAYAVCLEEGLWPKKEDSCLAYSFGIDYEWSFDEGMEALGCQVHSFDPGMYDEPEHAQHSDNIFFHRWGIGEVDSDALYQRAMRDYAYRKKYGDKKLDELRKWKVRTLHSIVHELGHHGRIIDAVKIDIEGPRIGYEDKAIRSIIETGIYKCIRQISLELHVFGPINNPEYVRLQYSVMKALEEKGFKLFDVKESFGRSMEDIRGKVVKEKTQLLWCLGWVNTNVQPCS